MITPILILNWFAPFDDRAFCWDWKNIIRLPDGVPRTGIPNPFAWWLYVPAYLFSVVYFAVRFKQIVIAEKH